MNMEERDKRWADGQGYNRYIQDELSSFRKEAWKKQLETHFEGKKNLQILDVGTGPGFFACILAEDGHQVTGIDRSEGMLACARENARKLGVTPNFQNMDVEQLDFPDETFDAIVSRNVTWTLEHPESVYTELKRVLKPGGVLLIYDANWHQHFYDEEKMKRVRAREQRHLETYGKAEVVSGGDLEYFATAPLTRKKRPQWDVQVLRRLGMKVQVQEDVGQAVYEQWEKDLYGESPLFEICAIRQEVPETEEAMRTYWQKRAESFGFDGDEDVLEKIQCQIARYLPKGRLKILDAGTGTGILAAAMALLGHDVTAIDLCSNMIEKAKANMERLGVEANFLCTAAGELPFEENTFDVVVSRNVTWVLPEPEQVLLQWQRVLKPGGLLIYLDGNHYYYLFHEEDRKNREWISRLNGSPHARDNGQVDYSLCDETALRLPLSRYDRPSQWDEKVLPRLGFDIVAEEIERPQQLLKYGIGKGYYTQFLIAARNGKGLELR